MYWEYVIAGYTIVAATLGVYTFVLMRRVRKAAENVPSERRRFLNE